MIRQIKTISMILLLTLLSLGSASAKDFVFKGCNFTTVSGTTNLKVGSKTYKCDNVKLKGYHGTGSGWETLNFGSRFEMNGNNYIITVIANDAFKGNRYIQSITLPARLDDIGARAFKNCTNLKTVTINDEGTGNSRELEIETGAFQNCTNLTSVRLPWQLHEVGSYAFANCSQASFSNGLGGSSSILKYIYANAFANCQKLTADIPATVTQISEGAFRGSGITTASIPKNCSLGKAAFCGCFRLKAFILASGSSLTSLPDSLFWNCSMLKTSFYNGAVFKLPAKITKLGNSCFEKCDGLGGFYFLTSKAFTVGDRAFSDCKNMYIENLPSGGFEKIGSYGFYNTAITSIHIDTNLGTLGSYAFAQCKQLSVLYFYSTGKLASFSSHCFDGCSKLTTFYEYSTRWATVKYLPRYMSSTGSYAFYNCTSLKEIVFEWNNMKTINSCAFYGCTGLTSIAKGSNCNVQTIEDYAFYGCTSMSCSDNLSTLKTIGSHAFDKCTSYKDVYFYSNLSSLGSYAFANSGIKWLNVSDKCPLTSFSDHCFYNCQSLTTFYRYDSNAKKWVNDGDKLPPKITSTGSYAFAECTGLKSITFGDKMTEISDHAFYSCSNLTTFDIGSSKIKSFGDYAFAYCSKLNPPYTPSTLETIGNGAFFKCTSLSGACTPQKLKTIGDYAFSQCYSLLSINASNNNSLTSIGESAFYGCSKFEGWKVKKNGEWVYANQPNSIKTIGSSAFRNCTSLRYYYVSPSSSDLETIGDYAFDGCSKLEHYVFSDELETIGKYAFRGTILAPNFSYATSLKTIGDYAFYNLNSIVNVDLPKSVKTIGEKAFAYCYYLKNFNIVDNNLKTIGKSAFEGCTRLNAIRLPDALTSIGDRAFYNTPGMKIVMVCNDDDPLVITSTTFRGGNSDSTKPKAELYVITNDTKKVNKYTNSTGWKDFPNRYHRQNTVETESGMIFRNTY